MSISLSGNKSNPALNTAGKESKFHAMIYKADKFSTPEIGLSAAGLILFALVAGGDYNGVCALCLEIVFSTLTNKFI